MKTLSVCIIAKNEENNLPRCIGSIEHIADEIIVVDTGSTDNTALIAEGFGAKVISYPFNNDFSEVRNVAVDNATCDWILYIDCDEAVNFEDAYTLKDIIQDTTYIGMCLKLMNIIDQKPSLSCPSLRVFKNYEGFRFTGKIHEQLLPSIHEKYTDDDVLTTSIALLHYGYDEKINNMEAKNKRNLDIFKTYEDDEKDGFYFYNLGNQYLSSGDFENALKNYKISLTYPDNLNGYKLYLPIYITKAYFDLRRYNEAIESALQFLKEYPTFKDLHFLAAASYYELEDYIRAKGFFINYLEFSRVNYGFPDYNLAASNDIPKLLVELDEKIFALSNQ